MTKERKKYSYQGMRIPSTILYPEHKEAMTVVERFWKKIMGRKYAFADVQRQLLLQEAARIKKLEEEENTLSK